MATIDSVKLPDNSTYDLTDNYSGYAKKVAGAITDDLASLTATGDLADSGKKLSDLVLKADVKDVLNSTSTTDPLSANQGRVLADNLAANEESGAKNHADASTATTALLSNNNGVFTNTVADDYSYFYMYIQAWTGGTFISNIANQGITATGDYSYNITIPSGTDTLQIIHNGGIYDLRAKFNCNVEGDYIISFRVLGTDPRTIGGLSFDKVMLRDDRITDPTYEPYAKTNKQLTADKAERSDLATLNLTGSTNTTGTTIKSGTFFYLNGSFCKATADIAANATFTLNTNFKVDSVGEELKTIAFNSPLRKPLDPNSSVSYTVPIGVYLVTSCQYGVSDDFSGLWIAFVALYATGCSVFPLVTPNYITVSVSTDTITIANSDSTFKVQTNITCITDEIT